MTVDEILIKVDEYFSQNQGAEAEKLLVNGLRQAESTGNEAGLLMLQNELMGYYRETSRTEESYRLAEAALAAVERMGLAGTLAEANTRLNIANAYRAGGRLDDSMACYRRVMVIYREQLPPEDMLIASLHNNISLLYQEMNDFPKAREHQLKALAIAAGHNALFETAVTCANLAATCLALHDEPAAGEYCWRALTLFRQEGIEDSHYCAALSAWGTLLYRRGKYEQAGEAFRTAMEGVRRSLGENEFYFRLRENAAACDEAIAGKNVGVDEAIARDNSSGDEAIAGDNGSGDGAIARDNDSVGEATAGDNASGDKAIVGDNGSGDEAIARKNTGSDEAIAGDNDDDEAIAGKITAGNKVIAGNKLTGLALCRAYYEAFGKPMIKEQFGEYENKIAVGLVGEGSDCFGFDDEISRDHDWGPGFCLWVSEETYGAIGVRLQAAYDALPTEFMGCRRQVSPHGRGRMGVCTIAAFYARLTGGTAAAWRTVADSILPTENDRRTAPVDTIAAAVDRQTEPAGAIAAADDRQTEPTGAITATDDRQTESAGVIAATDDQRTESANVLMAANNRQTLGGITLSAVSAAIDWRTAPDSGLAAAVNGEVFRDGEGIFSAIRNALRQGFPLPVQYLKIAESSARFSQCGQYNYPRMLARQDKLTAQIMLADSIKEAMKLLYYAAGFYPPHDKWLCRGLRDLPGGGEFYQMLSSLPTGETGAAPLNESSPVGVIPSKENNPTGAAPLKDNSPTGLRPAQPKAATYQKDIKNDNRSTFQEKDSPAGTETIVSEAIPELIEEIARFLALKLYRAGFISDTDPYLDSHTEELLMKSAFADKSIIELAQEIAETEFAAFDLVRNVGGRASCQNDWPTFSIMRRSQYLTWNRPMLIQYLFDFKREFARGHNLVEEKYGRMMASTAPAEYAEIAAHFPAIDEPKQAIIESVVRLQTGWMEEFEKQYPHLAANARTIHTYEDRLDDTSYETYLRGEISTYSDKMLELYGKYVVEYAQKGENLATAIMANSAGMYGYRSLTEAEAAQSAADRSASQKTGENDGLHHFFKRS